MEKKLKEINLERSESQKLRVLMEEKKRKEKEEEKRFKEEDLREKKRIKSLNELRSKKEMQDEIERNISKSRLSRISEYY
jgi:hypothetical protein